jgi:hypothetical protein
VADSARKHALCEKGLLAAILSCSFLLRIYGIDYNLLDSPMLADEEQVVVRALRFGQGDLNPHWFLYPSFYLYAAFFFYGVYFLAGSKLGLFPSPEAFAEAFFSDPAVFYLIPRSLSAIVGTLTVLATYLVAKKSTGNKSLALLSAFFLSVSFYHVRESHSAKPDAAMIFLLMLSLLFCLQFAANGKPLFSILAGLLGGLAISTKYPAGILVAPIILAHLSCPHHGWRMRIRLLVLSGAMALLGFVLGTPYALLDWGSFSQWLGWVGDHRSVVWRGQSYAGEFTYFRYLLSFWPQSSGFPLWAASLTGAAVLIRKQPRQGALLLAFPLTYLLSMGASTHAMSNFFTPCVPFMMIFAAASVWYLGTSIERYKKGIIAAAAIFLSLPAVSDTAKQIYEFSTPETFNLARRWVEHHVPHGRKILTVNYSLPFNIIPEQVDEILQNEIRDFSLGKGSTAKYTGRGRYFEYLRSHPRKPAYRVVEASGSQAVFEDTLDHFEFARYADFDCILLCTIGPSDEQPGQGMSPITIARYTPDKERRAIEQYDRFVGAIRRTCHLEATIDRWNPESPERMGALRSFFWRLWGRPGPRIEIFTLPQLGPEIGEERKRIS